MSLSPAGVPVMIELGRNARRVGAGAVAAMALLLVLLAPPPAGAQSGAPVLQPGNAVVTGFSGALPPGEIPVGVDPGEQTTIDLNGPSARVVDLGQIAGRPPAPFVPAPKPFTVTAAQVGQVFGVALDNAIPPNIYLAASSSYGLPVATVDAQGVATHVRRGGPGVRFMPGLWGPEGRGGGPGSIWKVDGASGAVSLFANVGSGAVASLGALAYDPSSNGLFVSDRGTGLVHRFDMTGIERGVYDHGGTGRPAAGLSPVPLGGAGGGPDITAQAFDSEDPSTWGYAPFERRVFGLAVHAGRLFYAVAGGLQIWSVGLGLDGTVAADARVEVDLPPADSEVEVSKITFDHDGRMVLAERPAPTGAFDMEALATEGSGRVLRYALAAPYPGAPRVWQEAPDEYAIGFPLALRNANGGVALGWSYDEAGRPRPGTCGQYLWATGEQLRKPADPALAATLAQGGPLDVDGLQGDRLGDVRPANAPPLASPFIDYDDRFDDTAARGHMGDVVVAAPCAPALRGGAGWDAWGFGTVGWILPEWLTSFFDVEFDVGGGGQVDEFAAGGPPPLCPSDQQKPGFQCCPKGSFKNGAGHCAPICPSGATDPQSLLLCSLGFDPATSDGKNFSKAKCIGGAEPDTHQLFGEQCAAESPVLNTAQCASGWEHSTLKGGQVICLPSKQDQSCEAGTQVSTIDHQCHKLCAGGGLAYPTQQCCPAGATVSGTGQCCPPGTVPDEHGTCSPPHQTSCPAGFTPNPVLGGCCPPGATVQPDGQCHPPGCPASNVDAYGQCCPPDQMDSGGACRLPVRACPAPNVETHGKCCSPDDLKPGGACATAICPGGKVPVQSGGACCDGDKAYDDANGVRQCCPHAVKNGKCQKEHTPGGQCPAPYSKHKNGGITHTGGGASDGAGGTGSEDCCRAELVTSAGQCCPAGTSPGGPNNGQCVPHHVVCKPHETDINGICVQDQPPPTHTNNKTQTCPGPVRPDGTCPSVVNDQQCHAGYTKLPNGNCCPQALVSGDGLSCRPRSTGTTCPPGQRWNGRTCVQTGDNDQQVTCPPGQVPLPFGGGCRPPVDHGPACPSGSIERGGRCAPVTMVGPVVCGPGFHPGPGGCVRDPVVGTGCPAGTHPTGRGCRPDVSNASPSDGPTCPTGAHLTGRGCRPDVPVNDHGGSPICPAGTHPTRRGCRPDVPVTNQGRDAACPVGTHPTRRGCRTDPLVAPHRTPNDGPPAYTVGPRPNGFVPGVAPPGRGRGVQRPDVGIPSRNFPAGTRLNPGPTFGPSSGGPFGPRPSPGGPFGPRSFNPSFRRQGPQPFNPGFRPRPENGRPPPFLR